MKGLFRQNKETAQTTAAVPRLARLLFALVERAPVGSMRIVLPDGTERVFPGSEDGPNAVVMVHHNAFYRRLITGGMVGVCDAYVDGQWSSPDVEAVFLWGVANRERLTATLKGGPVIRAVRRVMHVMRPNTRRGSRRNIAAHYDLGNAFFEKWLDPSLTYSCAMFDDESAPLDEAQRRKYELIAQRAGIAPDHSVLEIGCGWGGFAEFAGGEIGAKVTALTISQAQHDYASARIQRAGLNERVEVRLQDYRDVNERFDRIASIEMFEAVGERYWPTYFKTVHDRLDQSGVAALQIITIADEDFDYYRRNPDYVQKYIFPGGMLPSVEQLRLHVQRAGLAIRDLARYGLDYARTLRQWNQRFQAAWPEIQSLGFDGRFKRIWEQYLHYCAAAFQTGRTDLVQVAVTRD